LQPVKKKGMKAIVGISTRMILLTLIYIADCFDESSDSGNSSDGGGIHSPGCAQLRL
jgi:hypothetical protein